MTVPYSRRMQGYGSDFIKEMFDKIGGFNTTAPKASCRCEKSLPVSACPTWALP